MCGVRRARQAQSAATGAELRRQESAGRGGPVPTAAQEGAPHDHTAGEWPPFPAPPASVHLRRWRERRRRILQDSLLVTQRLALYLVEAVPRTRTLKCRPLGVTHLKHCGL